MGQGTIRISASAFLEVIADIVDLDTVKSRLFLPGQYRIEKLSADLDHYNYAALTVSAPEIPDGAEVSPYYQRDRDEETGEYTTKLLKVEVIPGDQNKQ